MRRKPPATSRRSTVPATNLKAFAMILHMQSMADVLAKDAALLQSSADPKDTRTRGVINDMRRVAKWYDNVREQR